MAVMHQSRQLVTLRQLSQIPRYEKVFTESRLRALIAAAHPRLNSRGTVVPGNGLLESGAIIRVGKRILVEPAAFERWLTGKNVTESLKYI